MPEPGAQPGTLLLEPSMENSAWFSTTSPT